MNFAGVQARFSALFVELGMGPGSLYSEIVDSPPDSELYPEVEWDASVRFGEDLCLSERAFLSERRRVMKAAFARLMGVSEKAVDERDIPIIAIAGSGGGMYQLGPATKLIKLEAENLFGQDIGQC